VDAHGHPRLRPLLQLVGAVLLAGVLTAAVLTPWLVGPGLAARSSANLLEPLPSALPFDTGDRCTPEAMPPAVATTLNQILIGDVDLPIGTGVRARIPDHQVAGKTGTSQNRFSIAFIGYTPRYTASVMVLNPKRNEDVGTYGGGYAAQVWHDTMTPVIAAGPRDLFPPPGMPLPTPSPPPR
jgi:membrane peptidoglycan carboxypeptidase